MTLTINPVAGLEGSIRPPSDKSLTHRGYMFAAFAKGASRVKSPLRSEDCEATLKCLVQMGSRAEWVSDEEVVLIPPDRWHSPDHELDCGNSGTTMRLLSGLIASRPINATMVGDASLSRRPMGRIVNPLRLMGADVEGETPPLKIRGSDSCHGITYESPVASAQIKSAILLAGLSAHGETVVIEPFLSRDHTERMLRAMGASLISTGGQDSPHLPGTSELGRHEVRLTPTEHLKSFTLNVPGDISSAAFFMVAAAIVPNGRLTLTEVSINPTRTGILDVFEQCGIEVHLNQVREETGEPMADLRIENSGGDLAPFTIEGSIVPRLIDEIPVLAILASQCSGVSHIRNAAELRVKESDRIELIANGLQAMGVEVETHPDGMAITGPTKLKGTRVDCHGDHRIGMAFAIAGLIAEGATVIEGAESIATSFPNFEKELRRLILV